MIISKIIRKSHNVLILMYHFVCPAKYRRVVISEEVDRVIKETCIEISKRYPISFLEIGTDKDHVHFLIQSVPKYSPTEIIRITQIREVHGSEKSGTPRKPRNPYLFQQSFNFTHWVKSFGHTNSPLRPCAIWVCGIQRKLSFTDSGIIKSITAKQVFKECPEVKRVLWGGEFWSDGFYVATVSEHGNEKVISNYVKNQGNEYNKIYQGDFIEGQMSFSDYM